MYVCMYVYIYPSISFKSNLKITFLEMNKKYLYTYVCMYQTDIRMYA